MPAGQPTKYNIKYCQEIIDFMSDGSHIHDFAAHIGVAESTVYKWAKDIEEFSESVQTAITKSTAVWSKNHRYKAFGVTDKGSDRLLEQVLKNKAPHIYGDKREENKIEDTGANILDKLSSETLSAMAKDVANAK